MKVHKVWECECGTTKLLTPPGSNRLIIRGDAFFTEEPISKAQQVITRCCSNHYLHMPAIVKANELKRIWNCRCGSSSAIISNTGSILLQGESFAYGSPATFAKCSNCKEEHRLAPDIIWASDLAIKQQKRAGSKANRKARRRRQKSF